MTAAAYAITMMTVFSVPSSIKHRVTIPTAKNAPAAAANA